MNYVTDELIVEVRVGIGWVEDFGNFFYAGIHTGEFIEPTESVEGDTLKECLLNLCYKLDEMGIDNKNADIFGEWGDYVLSEEDRKIWGTSLKELKKQAAKGGNK